MDAPEPDRGSGAPAADRTHPTIRQGGAYHLLARGPSPALLSEKTRVHLKILGAASSRMLLAPDASVSGRCARMRAGGRPGRRGPRLRCRGARGQDHPRDLPGFLGTERAVGDRQGPDLPPGVEHRLLRNVHLNLGHAGGNLVVFKTGALLRFENLEIKDGSAAVRVAGGSAFIVPESLVDFEGSVREGAMLRLPASAMGTVSVSTSARGGVGALGTAGGGFDEMAVPEEYSVAPPDPEAAAEPPPDAAKGMASRPTRPGRPGLNRPRRFGADRGGESGEAAQEVQPLTPDDDSEQLPSDGGDSVPFGRGQQGGGGDQVVGGQSQVATGQTVLLLSTTYSGEIGGLQVTVTFPPNLKVVQPVGFSGFAATLAMPTVNANVPGQVQLIAVNSDVTGPGVQAGGEFLRLTFTWSGRAPTAQQFSVAVKATDPSTGAELPEFPRELSVF